MRGVTIMPRTNAHIDPVVNITVTVVINPTTRPDKLAIARGTKFISRKYFAIIGLLKPSASGAIARKYKIGTNLMEN